MENHDTDQEYFENELTDSEKMISGIEFISNEYLSMLTEYLDEFEEHIRIFLIEDAQRLQRGEKIDKEMNDWILKHIKWLEFLYKSITIMTFSILEFFLNYYCRWIGLQTKSAIKLEDIRGQGLERGKIYLSKIGKIESVFQGDNWEKLIWLSRIRNIITHNDSFVDENNTKLSEYIQKTDGLSLNEHREIELTSEYCKAMIRCTMEFNNKIAELCKKKYAK